MIKIFYKKDIIGNKVLNPITEKNKIRRFMKKAGYEPSANLSEICSYYPYWFNCNIIILAERLKLVPWMNNAKVITDNHETWWHVPMEAYNFISAFNSWYKNNIDKDCLDISFYNWSIEKRTKLLNDFVKNINYLDDILNRDPNEDIIEIIDIKHPTDRIENIIDNINIFKGYHMNKKHWITIILDNKIEDKILFKLIDTSYILTFD